MAITVNTGTTHQTVEGCRVFLPFDGNNYGGLAPTLDPTKAVWLFDASGVDGSGNALGIGASLCHAGIAWADAPSLMVAAMTTAQLQTMFSLLASYGVGLDAWISAGSYYGSGWTSAGIQNTVSGAIAAAQAIKSAAGQTPHALIFGNEPDYLTWGYGTTPAQLVTFATDLKTSLAALSSGDPAKAVKWGAFDYGAWSNFASAMSTVASSDAADAAAFDAWTVHGYDNGPALVSSVLTTIGRPVWQTEISQDDQTQIGRMINGVVISTSGDTSMMSALTLARYYARSLLTAQVSMISGFTAWNVPGGAGAMTNNLVLSQENGAQPTSKKFWGYGNWARFIRPGAQAIDVSGNPSLPTTNVGGALAAGPYAAAFVNPSGQVVVVAVNEASSSAALDLTFSGTTPGQLTPWITDATRNLQQQATPVTPSGSSFSYTMPAQSIVTLVSLAPAGAAGGSGSAAGSLTYQLPISGSAGGGAGGASSNPATVSAAGATGGAGAGAASLTVQPPLVGTAGGQAGASGALSQASASPKRLFAVAAGDGAYAVIGTPVWNVTAGDNLPIGIGIAPTGYFGPGATLSGSAGGHAGATAIPGIVQGLAGGAGGHAGGAGAIPLSGLGGEADAHGGASASLSQTQPLSGEADAHAGATATGPQTPIPLSGAATGVASAGASDPTKVALSGAAEGRASLHPRPVLTQQQQLSGEADAHASAAIRLPSKAHATQAKSVAVSTAADPVTFTTEASPIPFIGSPNMATTVYLGDDKPFSFPVPDDMPVDLTNAAFYCDVKTPGGSPVAASRTYVDPMAKVCWAWFLNDVTAALTPSAAYAGDGLLVFNDGSRHTIGTIQFIAKNRVTPNPS